MSSYSPDRRRHKRDSIEASPLLSKFEPRPASDALSVEVAPPPPPDDPQNESEEADFPPEEQVLELIDRIEDDWDKATYEELVPLDIRLAVEDKIFGWTHLTSDVLGHMIFTLGAFLVVYLILWYPTERFHVPWIRWLLSGTS